MEPYKKRRWRRASSLAAIPLFTCARPGRSKGKTCKVADSVVDLWIHNVPGPNTAVISLLGQKQDGTNEWSFYSFYPKESFQQWLTRRCATGAIDVIEHPTIDYKKISGERLKMIAKDVEELLAAGRTVVVIDSGGETRTRQVMTHMKFVEDTRSS